MSFHSLRFACVLAAALLTGTGAFAQNFPVKPIRFIVASTPGTLADLLPRTIAAEMPPFVGQPVIVENKPGANSIIGYEYVAKQAAPDGYTLVGATVQTLASIPLTNKDLRFDPLRDLPPLIGFAEGRFALVSAPRLPWKTFKELLANASANPGKLNYGAPTVTGRLPIEAIIRAHGVNITFIPYPSSGPFIVALVAGEVDTGFLTESSAIGLGSKLRVLGVTGATRSPAFPDVPSFDELGHPEVRSLSYSLNMPVGVPRTAIDSLYTAVSRSLQQPTLKAVFAKSQLDIVTVPKDVAAKQLLDESRLYADIVKKAGLKLD
jgi:tripartite-type tricarboxylate transporter receptor subunit TctC